MRRLLFLCGVLLTPLLTVCTAFGQGGTISIFADAQGGSPYLYDKEPGMIAAYVVHTSAEPVMACQFSAPIPSCFQGTYLADEKVFPVTIGNSQWYVGIGYGVCQTTPLHVLTIYLYGEGLTSDCCEWEIQPYRSTVGYDGWVIEEVAEVDCDLIMTPANAGTAIINPGRCDCKQPTLTLEGYHTVSWEDPIWTVEVGVVNSGPALAKNVSVTMHEDIPWLVLPDANCFYGDVIPGETLWGAGDTYVFDLTGHPGGSFNAWFDVSYEDTCGDTHTLRLDPEFDPEAEMARETASNAVELTDRMLGQNYPNPFNPVTTIPVNLREAMNVRLSVFDSRGALVRTLADDRMPAGLSEFVWDGRDSNGNVVGSGMYFCRLNTGTSIETRKIVFLK